MKNSIVAKATTYLSTKGSKNRPKTNITKDYATQIAEKQETIASLNAEIASITANIDTLKADLKEKKNALKKAEKEVASLEAKKAKEDAKAAEEAKKAEAESVLKKLLAANSHFLRTAGPHSPDSPGHIKRTVLEISRAERGLRPANQYQALSQKAMPSQSVR